MLTPFVSSLMQALCEPQPLPITDGALLAVSDLKSGLNANVEDGTVDDCKLSEDGDSSDGPANCWCC